MYSEVDGFEDLVDYVRSLPSLQEFLVPGSGKDRFREHVMRVNIGNLPETAAERHIFAVGLELDEDALRAEVERIVTWWVSESLPVDIVVPILNVGFEVDRFELGERAWVERMTDAFQLARWPGRPRANRFEDILPMATHALVLANWELANHHAMSWLWVPNDEPIEAPTLEHFFQALVVCVAPPSGYVQIVYRPVGWAHAYGGPLPVVIDGRLLEHYSRALRVGTEPQAVLNLEQLQVLQSHFASLEMQDKTVAIAAQRLVDAERRNSDVDRILDLCIGIEALVAGEPGDTTYKIMMRIAAVLAELGTSNSLEIMEAARAVYRFRSAIVHGRGTASKTSHVVIGSQQVSTPDAARYFLRSLLNARLQHPTLTTDDIDYRIIAGALQAWAGRDRSEQ